MDFNKDILNTKLPNKSISGGFDNEEKTIEDFYRNFIEKRLPNPDVVYKWHEALVDYCTNPRLPNPILFIRGGSSSGHLRRGFLIKASKCDFYYAFSDNYMASYIYKMALDGVYPDNGDELYKLFTEFVDTSKIDWLKHSRLKQKNVRDKYGNGKRWFPTFPVHYKKSGGKNYPDKYEQELNSFIINGPVCSIGECGYKHSHVFDAGNKYIINAKKYKISEIIKKWFSLQSCSKDKLDFEWDSTKHNYVAKNVILTPTDKYIGVACFLRFLDPINHFLAPKEGYNIFTAHTKAKINDIAEYPHLIEYIKMQFKKRYIKHYNDFCNLILCDNKNGADYGSEEINVRFVGLSKIKIKTATVSPHPAGKRASKHNAGKRRFFKYSGMKYNNRNFVNAVVMDYIRNHKDLSSSELDKIFKGLILDSIKIKDKKRAFNPIKLENGDEICISNQISNSRNVHDCKNINVFLDTINELGITYEIE